MVNLKFKVEEKGLCIFPRAFFDFIENLEPGNYNVSISAEDIALTAAKKAYFVKESELAKYIGYSKKEIHEALKLCPDIGKKLDENGNLVHVSISDITTMEDMVERHTELDMFASKNFSYTFKNYEQADQPYRRDVDEFFTSLSTRNNDC